MKSILKFSLLLIGAFSYAQNNLLDTSTWTVGSGSVTGFPQYGSASENVREFDTDPFGNQSIIWKGVPETVSSSGGWISDTFPVDHTKTYRLTVWMKKQNSFTGSEVFATEAYDSGGNDTARRLDNTVSGNPIFEGNDVPELDKWYLYVGFLHHSGYTETTSLGGVYDPVTGNKVMNSIDFKLSSNSVTAKHRTYYWNGTNALDVLSFYGPTVYEVNGQEPSITELINPGGSSGSGQAVWNTSGNDIDYTAGNVGIGTTAQANYRLAVDGTVHTREVKVDLTGWADYVFTKGYELPTLEEVQKHIQEKGHLINIPSAAEVEANGIALGEMNKLLLEKIEELTLYTLEQQKTIQYLINEINLLKE